MENPFDFRRVFVDYPEIIKKYEMALEDVTLENSTDQLSQLLSIAAKRTIAYLTAVGLQINEMPKERLVTIEQVAKRTREEYEKNSQALLAQAFKQ